MIFVDSNIPMYLVGADHPNKHEAIACLEKFVSDDRRLVTNTEVLQEILHRYSSLRRTDAIQPAFDALYGCIDEIFVISEDDVLAGKDLLLAYKSLSARDAIHAAHMRRHRITDILTFDRGFDRLPFVHRVPE